MPRKKTKSLVREIEPDRKYHNVRVARLINRVMLDGKKQLAERLVYDAMESAAAKLKQEDALEVLNKALDNVKPSVETRSRRVGGANYQIPFEVRGQRQSHLTLRVQLVSTSFSCPQGYANGRSFSSRDYGCL